ncbi:MAG: hypothetical protein ABIR59_13485 [Gemmatimonadales bacterium]
MKDRDHHISQAEAVALIGAHKRTDGVPHAWMFSRGIIDDILAQPKCSGVRIYMAGAGAETTVVVVGTDAGNDDLADGVIAEVAWPCPPICSTASPLDVAAP